MEEQQSKWLEFKKRNDITCIFKCSNCLKELGFITYQMDECEVECIECCVSSMSRPLKDKDN